MIGILVLTHGDLGRQFIETAKLIGLKSDECVTSVSVDPSDSTDDLMDVVEQAIRDQCRGDGVLILTDLFGGTPTNLSLTFLEEGRVEVVTGLNLPMVVKAINDRENHDLQSLARLASDAGRENIYLAGEVLRNRLSPKDNASKKEAKNR